MSRLERIRALRPADPHAVARFHYTGKAGPRVRAPAPKHKFVKKGVKRYGYALTKPGDPLRRPFEKDPLRVVLRNTLEHYHNHVLTPYYQRQSVWGRLPSIPRLGGVPAFLNDAKQRAEEVFNQHGPGIAQMARNMTGAAAARGIESIRGLGNILGSTMRSAADVTSELAQRIIAHQLAKELRVLPDDYAGADPDELPDYTVLPDLNLPDEPSELVEPEEVPEPIPDPVADEPVSPPPSPPPSPEKEALNIGSINQEDFIDVASSIRGTPINRAYVSKAAKAAYLMKTLYPLGHMLPSWKELEKTLGDREKDLSVLTKPEKTLTRRIYDDYSQIMVEHQLRERRKGKLGKIVKEVPKSSLSDVPEDVLSSFMPRK